MFYLQITFITALAFLPQWASAQFGFFDQMFHGQGHQYQQQQQQQRPGGSQWSNMADAVSCNQYLCPGTLNCVPHPVQCPCPYPEDIKCVIPDYRPDGTIDTGGSGTVVCVSGNEGCEVINRLS